MDTYGTEEEQVEALKRWWQENGRSTVIAIVLALVAGFGWQGWQSYDETQQQEASDLYQSLLQAMSGAQQGEVEASAVIELADQLKQTHMGSTYAQFAALHLARMAVENDDLARAEAELRWVLSKAGKGSDIARVTELRLARVLAASGDSDQALSILASASDNPYQASYEAAKGDILMGLGQEAEAREAYTRARNLAAAEAPQASLPMLEQKLQSLNPVPERSLEMPEAAAPAQPEAVAADAPAVPAEEG
ncbi:MAG: tetratricopeptide repeat protein [Halieaceae bacterium]